MHRSTISCVFALAVAGGGSGCGGRSVAQSIVDYPIDRAKDLMDVIGFEFYWGQGLLAQAQATKFAQIGAGTFDGEILSYRCRSLGAANELRAEAGLPLYYFAAYDRSPIFGITDAYLESHKDKTGLGEVHYSLTDPNDRGFYEVGGRLTAFLGVGLWVDVLQACDFFAGFVGADIGRDDRRHMDEDPDDSPRPAPIRGPWYKGPSDRPLSGGVASAVGN
jgi:hypothetical protein